MILRRPQAQGSVLLVTVFTVLILGVIILSAVNMSVNRFRQAKRSESWNSAFVAAEAGVEEALTHLNLVGVSNVIVGIPVLGVNGWTLSGGVYQKQRTLDSDSYYIVNISQSATPTVVSAGYYRLPNATNYISRRIQVTAKLRSLWPSGMIAKNGVNFNNSFVADSYDPLDPAYSTGGKYDAAKRKANADVGINRGDMTISLGKADVYGRLLMGPGGSYTCLKGGAVGSAPWVDAGKTGAEPGHFRDDLNLTFPDPAPPWSGGAFSPVGAGGYKYILTSGNWELSNLKLNNHDDVLVTGDAVLYVKGDVDCSSDITIQTNASLTIYVGGSSANFNGASVINTSGEAKRFVYYGLKSNTSITYSGHADWCGVLYAPRAAFSYSGGSEFFGTSMTSTFKTAGHCKYHYDESLAKVSPQNLAVTGWTEL
jgi:hypothetical protein